MKELAVTILGFGMMGRIRSHAYDSVTRWFPDSPLRPVPYQAFVLPHEADGAKALGWEPNLDLRAAITNPKTDYVDICLPNAMHYAAALLALEAGKHVFCEKPLAVSVAEAREMVAAAEARPDLLNSVHFTYRRAPANVYARRLIQQNRFGKLLESHNFYHQHWGGPGTGGSWRFDLKSGGGTVSDLGSHAIDMLYYTTGLRPVKLCALQHAHVKERYFDVEKTKADGTKERVRELKPVDVDDASKVVYYLENGAIGTLSCTRNAHGSENSQGYELYFESGAIKWEYDDLDYLKIYDANDPARGWQKILCGAPGFPYCETLEEPTIGYRDELVAGCYENMRAIAGLEPIAPVATFRDAYEVDRTIEAIRLSAKEERWVRLEEIQ